MDVTGIGAIANLVQDGIDKIWPSKTEQEKDKAALLMAQLQTTIDTQKLQLQIDLAAEQQPGWFTKGRDGAMWVCVLGFAWDFFFRPMLAFVFIACGHPLNLPALDVTTTQDLLGGLLGLGGMHLYQATRGS